MKKVLGLGGIIIVLALGIAVVISMTSDQPLENLFFEIIFGGATVSMAAGVIWALWTKVLWPGRSVILALLILAVFVWLALGWNTEVSQRKAAEAEAEEAGAEVAEVAAENTQLKIENKWLKALVDDHFGGVELVTKSQRAGQIVVISCLGGILVAPMISFMGTMLLRIGRFWAIFLGLVFILTGGILSFLSVVTTIGSKILIAEILGTIGGPWGTATILISKELLGGLIESGIVLSQVSMATIPSIVYLLLLSKISFSTRMKSRK